MKKLSLVLLALLPLSMKAPHGYFQGGLYKTDNTVVNQVSGAEIDEEELPNVDEVRLQGGLARLKTKMT